jgi:hypothetical protein
MRVRKKRKEMIRTKVMTMTMKRTMMERRLKIKKARIKAWQAWITRMMKQRLKLIKTEEVPTQAALTINLDRKSNLHSRILPGVEGDDHVNINC